MLAVLSNFRLASTSSRLAAFLAVLLLLSAVQGQELSLRQQAASARESNRIDEAIHLYRRALAADPAWVEGWWYLGTLFYDLDDYSAAVPAFEHAATLDPRSAPTLIMLGLAEANTGKDSSALDHLLTARRIGIPPDSPMYNPMLFTLATLSIAQGETRGGFDYAQDALDILARAGVKSDELITALGLAVLRRKQVGDAVVLVEAAGLAEASAARRELQSRSAYADLVNRYGSIAGVQFAFGKFLVSMNDNEGAISAFKRELEISPRHLLACLGIAGLEVASQPADAVKYASAAVQLASDLPEAHYLLGSALFNLFEQESDFDSLHRAIAELEIASQKAPDSAKIYFVLGRAYKRADRPADAERALRNFARLNDSAREQDNQ